MIQVLETCLYCGSGDLTIASGPYVPQEAGKEWFGGYIASCHLCGAFFTITPPTKITEEEWRKLRQGS